METLKRVDPVLYSVREVSRILRTNTGFVYALVNAGVLPALKLKSLRIRKESLDKFLMEYEGYDLSTLDAIKKLVDAS